jgi:hypothetical protein
MPTKAAQDFECRHEDIEPQLLQGRAGGALTQSATADELNALEM